MRKKVIITGGAGFVGANLVAKLLAKKIKVHVLARKSGSLWRLEEFKDKIEIHEGYLLDKNKLENLCIKISPFAVYHLATYGSYPYQNDVQAMIDINITATLNLLNALEKIPYRLMLVAGSSSEYGKKEKPMKENDNLEPNNFYAVTKAASTHLVQVYSKIHKKPVAVLRLFNVYGPYEEKGRLVRSVVESAISDNPILLATGKEARDFIYVEDVADSFIHFTDNWRNKYSGEVFNIGTGKQTTIKDLARKVVRLSGSASSVRLNAYKGRPWDTFFWKADVTKTSKLNVWRPKHSLTQGLIKTIQWYKNL